MIVVLDLDDDDVESAVESIIALPRRPLRLHVMTEHSLEAHRIRRALLWSIDPAAPIESRVLLGKD